MERGDGRPPAKLFIGASLLFNAFGVLCAALAVEHSAFQPLVGTLVFCGFGSWPMVIVAREAYLAWRAQEEQRRHPDRPWLWDRWDPHVVEDSSRWAALVFFLAFGSFAVLLLGILVRDGRRIQNLYAFLLALCFVSAIACLMGSKVLALFRRGSPRARLGSFPYFAGEAFTVYIEIPELHDYSEPLSVTLNCVFDRWARSANSYQVSHDLHLTQATWCVRDPSIPDRPVWKVTMTPSREGPSTRQWRFPKIRWELIVATQTPGAALGRFTQARFNLPIYRRER